MASENYFDSILDVDLGFIFHYISNQKNCLTAKAQRRSDYAKEIREKRFAVPLRLRGFA
jgi:hypothetical protein